MHNITYVSASICELPSAWIRIPHFTAHSFQNRKFEVAMNGAETSSLPINLLLLPKPNPIDQSSENNKMVERIKTYKN